MVPFTALSISALLNTMRGALPPSSMWTLFTESADCLVRCFPTAVEPERGFERDHGDALIGVERERESDWGRRREPDSSMG